jgi:molecular chaperone DnaK
MAVIGIDLGTTNSCAAYCRPGTRDPKILPTRAGENLTPSVVSFRRSRRDPNQGEILVGRAALNNASNAPEDTIFSIKRLMGRTYDEEKVADVRGKFNYTIEKAPGEDPGVRVKLGGKVYTPVEISAMILKQIKEDAERALGEEVTHAVITVPAYFEERQRAATRKAGELAGLVVKKIIDEPTAAAIAFGIRSLSGERHRVLVYDLGGGTFDISILQMVKDKEGRDQVQVLQTEGDNWLGGDDFDRKIVEKILDWVKGEYNIDLSADKSFLLLAKQHAEGAKRVLSEATATDIVIPSAVKTPDGQMVDVEVDLTREEFELMIAEYVDRTMELVQKALREQNLTPEDISDVLLVGGATLTPMVYETVEKFFGKGKVKRTINPMECVALGAAVLAATLKGIECPECRTVNDEEAAECVKCGASLAAARSVGDTSLTEVTTRSLGIAAVRGKKADVFVPIIPKGTPYPLREPRKAIFFPTSGRFIRVPVYEGDDPVASRNEEQGVIEYELPEEIDVSTPVEVSFNYDRNRQLTVTIWVQGTNLIKTETLRRDRPRTARPVAPVEEEEEFWQPELDHLISFIQGFLERYGQYMEANQRQRVEDDIKHAQQLLFFPDEVEGRRMVKMLQRHVFNSGLASQIFLAEHMMDRAEPDVSRRIGEAINEIRKAHTSGDMVRVQAITNALRPLVAQVMARRTGIKELDPENYGGLLRTLED